MLEGFQSKVEQVAESYADLVLKTIKSAENEPFAEFMAQANEGIRMLNHVACTLERISRIQAGSPISAEIEKSSV